MVNVNRIPGQTQVGIPICRDCGQEFAVRTRTVTQHAYIPPLKWVLATRLMTASKKGMSAHQLPPMLGFTDKSGRFLVHRIRKSMIDDVRISRSIGGNNKMIEVDET